MANKSPNLFPDNAWGIILSAALCAAIKLILKEYGNDNSET